MKTFKVDINLYSIDELAPAARMRAIEDHRNFLLDIMCPEDFISGDPEYDTAEKLQEEYDAEYNYYSENDDPIIENIEVNEYLFFATGELADCTTYTGKHPKAGRTECKFMGRIYEVA